MGNLPMTKKAKSEVSYSTGMAESHCGKVFQDDKGYCKNFIGHPDVSLTTGKCRKVDGTIQRTYWCSLFEKAK